MSSEHSNNITAKIKTEAARLGFFACGIAKSEPVMGSHADELLRWVGAGAYAEMGYMARNTEKRLNPALLMPEVKSIICVALNYAPAQRIPEEEYQLAYYAYGSDYHDIMKAKLHALAGAMGFSRYRAFCDTAPVLERYWAVKAGLGWIGRNHNLIIPKAGSMFYLGELFVDVELKYDTMLEDRCGNCHACIDACPTKAIKQDGSLFDAEQCLSYQTIEHRGPLSNDAATAVGDTIYGCDRCQKACPWNRHSPPCSEPALQPKAELLSMTKAAWNSLTEDEYKRLFKGSAVKRAKYEGLMRNIRAVQDNVSTAEEHLRDAHHGADAAGAPPDPSCTPRTAQQ